MPSLLERSNHYETKRLHTLLTDSLSIAGATERFLDLMPVNNDAKKRIRANSMGDGASPLCALQGVAANVYAKLDYIGPSGSFKDRGASIMVAAALSEGERSFVIDSSGNAGAAVAAAVARFGGELRVFMPAGNSRAKQAQISAYGAKVELIEEGRAACEKYALEYASKYSAKYLSHSDDPYWLHGIKTLTYEVYEQLGGALPELFVLPVGHGTLLTGVYLGVVDLIRAGLVMQYPKFVAIRSMAVPYLETKNFSKAPKKTVAEGVAIGIPAYGDAVKSIIEDTQGAVLAIEDLAINRMQQRLAQQGFLVEPTAALAAAAIEDEAFKRSFEGDFATGARIVTVLCGSGLKTLSS